MHIRTLPDNGSQLQRPPERLAHPAEHPTWQKFCYQLPQRSRQNQRCHCAATRNEVRCGERGQKSDKIRLTWRVSADIAHHGPETAVLQCMICSSEYPFSALCHAPTQNQRGFVTWDCTCGKSCRDCPTADEVVQMVCSKCATMPIADTSAMPPTLQKRTTTTEPCTWRPLSAHVVMLAGERCWISPLSSCAD